MLTSAASTETCVPLKPASYIVVTIDPACSLPLFNGLAACDLGFVDFRIVMNECMECMKEASYENSAEAK